MIVRYGGSSGDKKLLADAQTMLADSRRKIDYIRMQQLRLRNMQSGVPDEDRNFTSLHNVVNNTLVHAFYSA